uniref:Uncharacterized protein n=1 Tax=Arundo donax TaxID=35708 RepID=A0A0A8YJ60_ARUDO
MRQHNNNKKSTTIITRSRKLHQQKEGK